MVFLECFDICEENTHLAFAFIHMKSSRRIWLRPLDVYMSILHGGSTEHQGG